MLLTKTTRNGQYRPLELPLAFRIYRRSRLFCQRDNIWWGFFAAIICYIITLIMADYTADKFQGFYDKMEGISIPSLSAQVSFHLP